MWERIWPALWWPVAILGLAFVIICLDLLPALSPIWHSIVLAALAIAFIASIVFAVRRFAWPVHEAARRRLEIASGFAHRPLAALDDKLAGGSDDPASQVLWQAYRRRIEERLARVRVGFPHPGVAARDLRAVRVIVPLAVVAAFFVAAQDGDWTRRFVRAATPGVAIVPPPAGVLDIWITPPAYTGQPPLVPRVDQAGTLQIPKGSVLLAQVAGGVGTPRLLIGDSATPFERIDQQSHRLTTTLVEGTRLRIDQGPKLVGEWPIEIVPDAPPQIAFVQPPASARRSVLRLDFQANDDYGVASAGLTIERATPPAGTAGERIDLPLSLPGLNVKEAKETNFHDLSAHPWAGLKVKLRLVATDTAGQTGTSPIVEMTLPERVFTHPVAKAVIEQRKQLVGDPVKNRSTVGRALTAIAGVPQQYGDDIVVFMGLRMTAIRLQAHIEPQKKDFEDAQSLLWDLALHIETGRLSAAERELRALQQRLQDALANRESDEEIEKLIQELQQAIDRYLQALMENAMRNPQDPRNRRQMDRNAQRVDRQDLQKMLDRARQMARTGSRDQAREMLQRLQQLLENLRAAEPQMADQGEGEGEGDGEGEAGESQRMLQGLQDMMRRQQQLTDRTMRRSQQGQRPGQRGQQPGQQGQPGQDGEGEDGDGEGTEQESLRRQLGDIMRGLSDRNGRIPNGFERAERAMRDSTDALRRGRPGRAVRPQMDALDQLRQGTRDLVQQMLEQMAQQQGEGGQGDPNQAQAPMEGDPMQRNVDPLGRNTQDGLGDIHGHVGIKGNSDLERARGILEELIRRSGERDRPKIERDYLERLLRRF
jgi:uncharacterized protein (TIGR02302 family)